MKMALNLKVLRNCGLFKNSSGSKLILFKSISAYFWVRYTPSETTTTTSTDNHVIASFSIYKGSSLLPNSTRTSSSNNAQVSLQSIVTIASQ